MTEPLLRRTKHERAVRARLSRIADAAEQIAEILSRIAHDVAVERNDQHDRHARSDWIAPDADDRDRLAGIPQPANQPADYDDPNISKGL